MYYLIELIERGKKEKNDIYILPLTSNLEYVIFRDISKQGWEEIKLTNFSRFTLEIVQLRVGG